MKTRWIKKFAQKAREVKLTVPEKRAMLSRILGPSSIPSPYSFFLTFMQYRERIVVAAVLVVFVLTSGGTSYAATAALPGDTLYSIKVNINEELQSLAAVTPDAKAKVEVKRTQKRLAEAEALSKKGKLNAETQAIIETNIENHVDNIKKNVATLVLENATSSAQEVIRDLKESFETHEASLSVMASSTASSTDEHIDDIIEKVKAEIIDIENGAVGASSTATSTDTGVPPLESDPATSTPSLPSGQATTTASSSTASWRSGIIR